MAAKKTTTKKTAKKVTKTETKPGQALADARKAKRYTTTVVTVDGKKKRSQGCGDDVAKELLGKTVDEAIRHCEKELGLDDGELVAKYAHLNPGMARMNSANRLRAWRKAHEA